MEIHSTLIDLGGRRPEQRPAGMNAGMRPFVAPLRRRRVCLPPLLAAYAAAWLAISQLPLAPALLAVALSRLALWRGLRQQGWLGAPLPQLEVSARGELIAHWPSHAEQVGVRADSLALPWLDCAETEHPARPPGLAAHRGQRPADALRRLRVYLRWAQPTTVA